MKTPFKLKSGNTTSFKEMGSGFGMGMFRKNKTLDPIIEQEAENEVANLPENEKNEILTQVVKEKKEADASGDTGDATII